MVAPLPCARSLRAGRALPVTVRTMSAHLPPPPWGTGNPAPVPPPAPHPPAQRPRSWSAGRGGRQVHIPRVRHLPPPGPARRRRSTRLPLPVAPVKAVAALCALVLVAGLGLAGRHLLTGSGGTTPVPVGPAALGDPEFDEVHLGVPADHEFVLPVSYDPSSVMVDGAPALAWHLVKVFVDPRLTIPAPDALVTAARDAFTVRPDPAPVVTVKDDGQSVDLTAGGTWGFTDRYYIAEYRDRTTGDPLPTPRVTMFTVEPQVAPASGLTFDVDEQGVGHFTWDAVPSAVRYWVVEVVPPDPRFDALTSMVRIVGETQTSSWTTLQDDEWARQEVEAGRGASVQNREFRAYTDSEDELRDPGAFAESTGTRSPRAYGVIVSTGAGTSPATLVSDQQVCPYLPVQLARNAYDEMWASLAATGDTDLPLFAPVTMADGRTLLKPVTYDPDMLSLGPQGAGPWQVKYSIDGTLLTGWYPVPGVSSQQQARAKVEAAVARKVTDLPATGAERPFQYTREPARAADASTVAPDVPYPVVGTNPLTQYIAANLVAGERYISLAAYLEGTSTVTATGVDLWDAVDEALAQNPYVVGTTRFSYAPTDQVLVVEYVDFPDPAARKAEQEAIAAAVQDVVSSVVTDSMSEAQKVVALNDHLAATAEYDYAARDSGGDTSAFPRAWTAAGVLLDGRGVCASYAHAFQALALAAGLDAMYVTGQVTLPGGALHAWNKVRVDGVWRVVDVTWNDAPTPNQYLLVGDAAVAGNRQETHRWVLDSRLGEYTAP